MSIEADALDEMATLMFMAAIVEHRCGELLDTLFKGGSATVGQDGKLIIYPASLIEDAMEKSNGTTEG